MNPMPDDTTARDFLAAARRLREAFFKMERVGNHGFCAAFDAFMTAHPTDGPEVLTGVGRAQGRSETSPLPAAEIVRAAARVPYIVQNYTAVAADLEDYAHEIDQLTLIDKDAAAGRATSSDDPDASYCDHPSLCAPCRADVGRCEKTPPCGEQGDGLDLEGLQTVWGVIAASPRSSQEKQNDARLALRLIAEIARLRGSSEAREGVRWPVYETPCIPGCAAAGPVTHTKGCHNQGKISPEEARCSLLSTILQHPYGCEHWAAYDTGEHEHVCAPVYRRENGGHGYTGCIACVVDYRKAIGLATPAPAPTTGDDET